MIDKLLAFFSKYKPFYDEDVHSALADACVFGGYKAYGAQYVTCDGRLIVSFLTAGERLSHPNVALTLDNFRQHVPERYKKTLIIWPFHRFQQEIPKEVQKQTDYVCMFYASLR